jgi:hypothetical protein
MHAIGAGRGRDRGVVRVENEGSLSFHEFGSRQFGDLLDAGRVIEYDAEISNPPDARVETRGSLAGLETWIAQDAFLALSQVPVIEDLLIRTCRNAGSPSAATVLIQEHDAVFAALIQRA